jgi:hypothetical protein
MRTPDSVNERGIVAGAKGRHGGNLFPPLFATLSSDPIGFTPSALLSVFADFEQGLTFTS